VEKRAASLCEISRSTVRPSRRLPRERTEPQTMCRECIRLLGDAAARLRLLRWDGVLDQQLCGLVCP
jgi:hypothetical protein